MGSDSLSDKGWVDTLIDPVPANTLPVREVYQILKDVALGTRVMTRIGRQTWDEVYASHFEVEVDGWRLSIYNDCDSLDYVETCIAPDSRRWSFDSSQRFGTDPVELMSTWEHQTFERLLKSL
ncbi:DUF7693 family protein [Pseudomonas caspiana]|uniref:DUF7693 family protein n=1 Tax=Pseudomonas caspiana TaxID=1451454 RepID=UPI001EE75623|nr:hypothetical protein [Pseudomonas caspiana]